jgi:glycosyltransferase involved in cell wall biosynthesis
MTKRPQLVTVVLSTYNMPQWLEKSLWGYVYQQNNQFDIIVADDGSDRRTADLIEQFRRDTSLRLQHVWHEDDGFRKCAILNRAIEVARGDYLIFSDGDCIPRPDFIESHRRAAAPGHFLSGGYYKLPMSLSQLISEPDIASGNAFSLAWLRANGLPLSPRLIRLGARGLSARLLNRLTPTRPTWNGNNSSGWSTDIRSANGFDERMRYGGEDRELGERLENAGIRGIQIRYQSVCLHLDHARGYVNDADLWQNRLIRDATRRSRSTWTPYGIECRADRRAA